MACKFVIFAALIAVSQAGLLRSSDLLYSSPLAINAQYARLAPLESNFVASEGSNPAYEFKYGVHDQITGDSKSAHEIRNGDVVEGTYSLNDPDGTRRTVDYKSTPLTGFQATVRKEPIVEAIAEPVLTKAIVKAPIELRKFETRPIQLIQSPATYAYLAPAAHSVRLLRTDAGLIPQVAEGFAAGSSSYLPANAPVLVRSW